MFRGVVSPPLRNMDAAFTKIVDRILSAVTKILTIFAESSIFCRVLNSHLYVFSSYLRPYQLVQYANLTNVNVLD